MKKVVPLFLVISCLFTTGCSIKKVEELSDKERFAKEYSISTENSFVYANYDKVLSIFENETAIVLFANSDDESSQKAVKIINRVAKKNKVKKIYYFNLKTLKEKQPKKYKELVKQLEKSIIEYKLELPTLYAIKEGKVINYSNSFSNKKELSEEYLTKERIKKIENKYLSVLNYEEVE